MKHCYICITKKENNPLAKNIIFYFTGSGNSLVAAKAIGAKLEDCTLANMRNTFRFGEEAYEKIGFVFPVYAAGMPRKVKDFIEKLNFEGQKDAYVFVVATAGSPDLNAVAQAADILGKQGVKVTYNASVRMFANYVGLYPMAKDVDEKVKLGYKQLEKISTDIQNQQKAALPQYKGIINIVHNIALSTFHKKDKGFNVSDDCVGCRRCVEICPVSNIKLEGTKPEFLGSCEQCMACVQWCPKQAINYKKKTQDRGRYTHPDVKWEELR